jgi:uncharacterized protein (TIGR02300 family)
VAKPELGTKRLCGNCGAKFYDLGKDPIVCPKCDTVFVLAPISSSRRPDSRSAAARGDDVVTPETQDADFVSLEDADAEAEGKKKDTDTIDGDDDLELDESLDDDDSSLIEEEEETDDDVTDIIGDREDEEEP